MTQSTTRPHLHLFSLLFQKQFPFLLTTPCLFMYCFLSIITYTYVKSILSLRLVFYKSRSPACRTITDLQKQGSAWAQQMVRDTIHYLRRRPTYRHRWTPVSCCQAVAVVPKHLTECDYASAYLFASKTEKRQRCYPSGIQTTRQFVQREPAT